MNNLSKDKKSLIINMPVELKVSANKFVNKVKLNKLESETNSIKMKLLEMRLKGSEKKFLTLSEFKVLLEYKSFSFSYKNDKGDIEYAFKPDKFTNILENLPKNITKNNIKDNLSSDIPISKKVADLQELIGLETINGIFNYNTLNFLVEKYLEKIINNDKRYMNIFDKILLLIIQLLGENTFSSYIKGLLFSYSYINSIESKKIKDFSKFDLLLDKYILPTLKPKIQNRIRIHKIIYSALDFNEPKNLDYLVQKELSNLNINDKIILLNEYLNCSIFIEQNNNNILKILNSIDEKNINDIDIYNQIINIKHKYEKIL